jgi:hypothetical protein
VEDAWQAVEREIDGLERALGEYGSLVGRSLEELFRRSERLESAVTGIADSNRVLVAELQAQHVSLEARLDSLQATLYDLELDNPPEADAVSKAEGAGDKPIDRVAYADMVRAVREAVRRELPRTAQLLVISRGDDRLLNLYGRPAWHFPRGEDGFFLGEYPADGKTAVEHLSRWGAHGAEFLIIPRTAFWWLNHYPELRAEVDRHYRTAFADEDVMIVDLRRDDPGPSSAEPAAGS